MHHAVIQYTCLLAIILFSVMLAKKIKVAYPIVLVLIGLPLGFVPFLQGVEIEPDLIFVIFLPPLLYEAAWNTSWKELWKWRRLIASFAFPVVILTSCVVAFVSAALIPGFTLATGFLLGGIVSPPDAVSASSILKTIKVPKRMVSIVEGESLLNDASSLVVFRFALAAVLTGTFKFSDAAFDFVLVIAMGIAVGVAVAMVFYSIHRWLPTSTEMDVVLTFISPYAMYMLAEEFHFSGVLAVVSGGLLLSARKHQFLSHSSRLQSVNVWQSVAFVLNGMVFMLIGLELPVVIRNLGPEGMPDAIKYAAIITGVLLVARLICTFGATIVTRIMSHIITVADPNPGFKPSILLGWTGMRGVVSLAAALSIPVALDSGAGFPNRDMILFITFAVIIVTLVLQGLTLPALVRWVNMPDPDVTISHEQQRQLIQKKMSALVLDVIDKDYAYQAQQNGMIAALKLRYTTDMELLKDWEQDDNDRREAEFYQDYCQIMVNLFTKQRDLLHQINKGDDIDEEIIKHQMDLIDLEEEKFRQQCVIGENK
ncbi:Na+/H+ antiporter [Mucilaginibacter myungsuensis]|uniref:Na+/H+ antiporter n=1 Tax=Mucilaginibacter myungsuensis TaxID=649104 RepID=A0A929KXY4_9SPHI|nr:Na+/H+ antiporter [Mucilaginibacter myungsuensis]MBE9662702.1 Na+/H+ antiporter [Mucilaginibacter myungsuensis]MDN3598122.1 Na+/H+ antiporter [Mucilaginibacter myungsuensis]